MANISSTYSSKELNITQATKLSIIIVVLIYLDGNEAKCKQRYPRRSSYRISANQVNNQQPKTTRKQMIQNISAMTILIAETTTILYQQLVN